MVGQTFDLFGNASGIQGLEHLHNPSMKRPTPLLQKTAVGHLVGEGVLEGVDKLRKEACLVEELGRLEVRQAPV